ncbi:MAG: STAS domain-containing protein [Methanoregulaceae archaeon]
MEILTTRENGILIVTLAGRMDADGTREFLNTSHAWHTSSIILDLCQLDYVCSSALRVFLGMKRESDKVGKIFVLAGSFGLVDRIIEVSGFDNIFPRYMTVCDALGDIAARADSGTMGEVP